ncbi:MAG: hypothetical protein WCS11_07835, partial [Dysgonamonadaceae bacterium]
LENSANSGLFNEFSRKLKDKRVSLKRQVISAQSLSQGVCRSRNRQSLYSVLLEYIDFIVANEGELDVKFLLPPTFTCRRFYPTDIRIACNLALATFLKCLSELERNVAKANNLCTNCRQ